MTVGQLIAKLSQYELNEKVVIKIYNKHGFAAFEDIVELKKECIFENYIPKDCVSVDVTHNHQECLAKLAVLENATGGALWRT
jgi:hypothetical protein